MDDAPAGTIQVHVTSSPGRAFYMLRWRDPKSQKWQQKSSKVPVGDNDRQQKKNRGVAVLRAAEWAKELQAAMLAEPAAEEAHDGNDLAQLIHDWSEFLRSSDPSEAHVTDWVAMIERIAREAKIATAAGFTSKAVAAWLNTATVTKNGKGGKRIATDKKLSAATSNHYLVAAKAFCNWLVAEDVLPKNPLVGLSKKNAEADRRHVRRAIDAEEFARLLNAAEHGVPIESVPGSDRVALYLLAAWTGFRRKELASLTRRSFQLSSDPPVVFVKAKASKRGSLDGIPLHPALVSRLASWFAGKDAAEADAPLLPLRDPSGRLRKTSKMMRLDLAAARAAWIDEAKDDASTREAREKSDFLTYCSAGEEFADFHSQRHTFVTNLILAGVPLAEVQKLARHSDPRITAEIYAHLEKKHLALAVGKLAPPPDMTPRKAS